MVEEELRPEDNAVQEEPEESPPEGQDESEQILAEIEEIRRTLAEKSDIADMEELKAWKYDALRIIEALKEQISELRKEDERILTQMREFTDIISKKNDEMREILEEKVDETKLKALRKDLSKMNKKLGSLMEETGFGEIIDVAKIPPNILEIVYDSTLKDISLVLWREYGPGAESIITDTLEKIRLETSGSEMFHYDGRYIVTRDVAKNIKRGMISAKQLQDTYEALIKSLSEFVPSYQPKNFKAMIKLKSQEYTVDKTTRLLEKMEKIEENLSHIDSMLSSTVSGLSLQAERISRIEKSLKEEMERRFAEGFSEMNGRLSSVEESVNALRKEYDVSVSGLESRLKEKEEEISALESRLSRIESVIGKGESEKSGEEDGWKEGMEGLSLESGEGFLIASLGSERFSDEERFVLSAIPDEGIAYGKLKKSVSALISSPLDDIVSSLVGKRIIREEKKGRTRRFFPASHSTGEDKKKEGKTEAKQRGNVPETDALSRVLDAVPDRGCTMNRLKKALGKSMDPEEVEKAVEVLVQEEKLVKTTRGRYTIYVKKEEKGGEKDA